jgi:hypothetical protein
MKLRILLSIASIYMAFVGLGLIFAPQRFGVGAVPTDPSAALIAISGFSAAPSWGLRSLTGWRETLSRPGHGTPSYSAILSDSLP